MTESAAELRRFAIECMGCAENAMERVTRDAWLEMAQKYLSAAETTEGRRSSGSKKIRNAYVGEWVLPPASSRQYQQTVYGV
jgi:hypothetical protein